MTDISILKRGFENGALSRKMLEAAVKKEKLSKEEYRSITGEDYAPDISEK